MIDENFQIDMAAEILKKFLPAEMQDEILSELNEGRPDGYHGGRTSLH